MDTTPSDKHVYIDEEHGNDEGSGKGTQELPYRSLKHAYAKEPNAKGFFLRKGKNDEVEKDVQDANEWKPAAKSAMKKVVNFVEQEKRKLARKEELEKEAKKVNEERKRKEEQAKQVEITIHDNLDKAIKLRIDEIVHSEEKYQRGVDGDDTKGDLIFTMGRVHRERRQKEIMFCLLRDGYAQVQCVITGELLKSYTAMRLTKESTIQVWGKVYSLPDGCEAPGQCEIRVCYFDYVENGLAVGGDLSITNRVQKGGDSKKLLDLRHLTLRGENSSSIMIMRSLVEEQFLLTYFAMKFRKVSPPAIVQTQVEGGSTLFKLDYFGEEAYLTQSSQLYLETCLPFLGNVFCIEKSFRAEHSLTRRHLSEYTHVEAELDFITFDDLLNHIEELIKKVVHCVHKNEYGKKIVDSLNPSFPWKKVIDEPFIRMTYQEALEWLNDRDFKTDEGKVYEFGDDISESAERKMTDDINHPIMLTHFPGSLKAFYMQVDDKDNRLTQSVDVLVPGVGELVGGSIRISEHATLMQAYDRAGIDPAPYYWYTDQRQYGSSPHGGYGLGLERFLAWICGQHTVRDCCLYPRYFGRCAP